MNERIMRLRKQSLDIRPSVSLERALLLTEFYEKKLSKQVSVPVARALAFKYILEHKQICIDAGELIVGERGPKPKATSTFPEICTHSLEDFRILKTREKISFGIDEKTEELQKNCIIPFWKGKSIRERIFSEMTPEWVASYEAGIFTEFMEQRAPGHTVLDDKIYRKGFSEFKKEIQQQIQHLSLRDDAESVEKKEQLEAMGICVDALIMYARRHAEKLWELAEKESDIIRKAELEQMAVLCERVPSQRPQTFWEALQYYWFVHLGVITELNTWDSFNPGRLDQHLYPFFKQDCEQGILDVEKARELLQAFWIKFNNQPAPPKVGVTAKESNTYTDFCLINLAGVNKQGENAANELTFLLLDVIEEMRLLQPSSMVQISKKSPNDLILRALKIIRTGYGQPSLFNSEVIIKELVRQGKSVMDAQGGGASGCVEAGAFGKESYILTGYLNLPKILEITLHNGEDPRTGKQIGIESGNPGLFSTFEDLINAFQRQLQYFVDIKIQGNLRIEKLWASVLPAPFLSLLIDDCIVNGKDYNCGGARYNTSYIQGVGLGSITDALTALRFHVFDKKTMSLQEFITVLDNNFKDFDTFHKELLYQTPKYGNDIDYADRIACKVFDLFFSSVDGRPNTKGGCFRINLLPTTCHIYFGSVTGALPGGRMAWEPLSEGISPVQGRDVNGPTAVCKSASKIDHVRTGGTLLNQKFTPQVLSDADGLEKLGFLVRSYFRLGGHHIQFNVVSAEILRKAQKSPERYRDLIVRVAGYSDYFVNLGVELQNEIIQRTEHDFF